MTWELTLRASGDKSTCQSVVEKDHILETVEKAGYVSRSPLCDLTMARTFDRVLQDN